MISCYTLIYIYYILYNIICISCCSCRHWIHSFPAWLRISVVDAGRKKRLTAKGEEPVIGLEEADAAQLDTAGLSWIKSFEIELDTGIPGILSFYQILSLSNGEVPCCRLPITSQLERAWPKVVRLLWLGKRNDVYRRVLFQFSSPTTLHPLAWEGRMLKTHLKTCLAWFILVEFWHDFWSIFGMTWRCHVWLQNSSGNLDACGWHAGTLSWSQRSYHLLRRELRTLPHFGDAVLKGPLAYCWNKKE